VAAPQQIQVPPQQQPQPGWRWEFRGRSGEEAPGWQPYQMRNVGPGHLYFDGPYVPSASELYHGQAVGPLTGR
jgi:hypothetical protein